MKEQQETTSSCSCSSSCSSQSYEDATAPLEDGKQDNMDEDSELSLHFQLEDVKTGLAELKDKTDEIRTGEIRPRGSRGSRGSRDSCESPGVHRCVQVRVQGLSPPCGLCSRSFRRPAGC